jgi:hypothetical protein
MGLRAVRPSWPSRRLLLLGAAPLPAILLAVSSYLLGTVLLATKEQCGVDACAYGMIGALFGIASALLLYFFGMGFSALGLGISGRPKPKDFTDIFS